jgi:predicted branched-subunit amino acid permease
MAYAVSAVAAGFSPLETALISFIVCAGGAQMAFLTIAASGGGAIPAVLTAAALNLRYILYGLVASVWLPRETHPSRPILAATMTDEGFALSTAEARHGRPSSRFLWGANLSMCAAYWAGTLAGLALGQLLPDPEAMGLDVIFPLSFIAILVPMLRTRIDLLVTVVGGLGAVALRELIGPGPAILVAVIVAACLGAALDGRWRRR